MPDQVSDVRLLDDGYSREVRSLFYHAYRHEPTFAYLMDAQRAGYDQRVRACVREMVERHLGEELPAIGLFIDDRLVAAAPASWRDAGGDLSVPPDAREKPCLSGAWRHKTRMSGGSRRRPRKSGRAPPACVASAP